MDKDKQYYLDKEKYHKIDEVLGPNDPIEKWIKDFIKSDDIRFKGKSKEERIEMAKGAYYAAQKKKKTYREFKEELK
jgi:hypothetical protein